MSTSNETVKEHEVCPKCGGFVEYDTNIMLCSYPAQYPGRCTSCNARTNTFCHIVNGGTPEDY